MFRNTLRNKTVATLTKETFYETPKLNTK